MSSPSLMPDEDDFGVMYEHVIRGGVLSRMQEAKMRILCPPREFNARQRESYIHYWEREYEYAKATYEEIRSGRVTFKRSKR